MQISVGLYSHASNYTVRPSARHILCISRMQLIAGMPHTVCVCVRERERDLDSLTVAETSPWKLTLLILPFAFYYVFIMLTMREKSFEQVCVRVCV